MKLSRPLCGLMLTIAVVAAACGGSDKTTTTGSSAVRTVDVTMVDNRFEPTSLTARQGEEVKFVFHNNGSVTHDAFVGDAAAQETHESEMMGGGGHMGGGEGGAITVDPGKTGTLTYTFDKAGEIEIGCHESGHYAGGMKVAVAVS